jgi:hypothetical protein
MKRIATPSPTDPAPDPLAPICPYCDKPAGLLRLQNRPVWACVGCHARVGCHPGSLVPLGSLANATTRALRVQAHRVFDPIWRAKANGEKAPKARQRARTAGYAWLALELGLPTEAAHIGTMSDADLRRVIALCTPIAHRLARR